MIPKAYVSLHSSMKQIKDRHQVSATLVSSPILVAVDFSFVWCRRRALVSDFQQLWYEDLLSMMCFVIMVGK